MNISLFIMEIISRVLATKILEYVPTSYMHTHTHIYIHTCTQIHTYIHTGLGEIHGARIAGIPFIQGELAI